MNMYGSYSLSIFFGKFFGVYLLIMFLLFLFRKEEAHAVVKKITEDEGLLAVTGMVNLLVGVAVVVVHTIFVSDWRVLVTLLGYFMILRGVMRIAFQKNSKELLGKMVKGTNGVVTMAVILVVGLILVYYGFGF